MESITYGFQELVSLLPAGDRLGAQKGLRLTCCVVYIDDVCVYSNGSLEDHLDKVRAVLRALRVVGFSGNPAKCKFAQREVVFLGHRIADGRFSPLMTRSRQCWSTSDPDPYVSCEASWA